MIIVMQNWRNIPARVIPNVSDAMFVEDDFVWRIGRSKNFNHSIPLDRLETEYPFAYIMGEDAHVFGCKDMIKWLVWKNFLIADMTESAANAYIKRNPING